MNRTDRLMGLLLELQARGELRGEDLARRFEVSVRTIYRDLQALSESGVPLVATPGKGFRLMEGYFLPPLSFTAAEAALLVLGGEFVRERVDPELRRAADDALRKLSGVLPAERRETVARWRRELHFARLGSTGDQPRLAAARRAIQERRVVRLLYHALRRVEPEWREVEPFSLVHLERAWYLVAWCRLRLAPRLFRLDRVDRLEALAERFTLDERHVARPEEWIARREQYPEARVRFDFAVERWVRERQPFIFLREELDASGAVFVYVLRDERELLGWLLSWGAAVQVLDPPELRERLAEEARKILARNGTMSPKKIAESSPAADRLLSGALAYPGS